MKNAIAQQANLAVLKRKIATKPRISSEKLFEGQREVIIEHASDEYRLRLTSQGKLILTK